MAARCEPFTRIGSPLDKDLPPRDWRTPVRAPNRLADPRDWTLLSPRECVPGQLQTKRHHWSEITSVAGCQSRLSPDGHGSDAAIRVGLGTPSGAVEKVRSLLGIPPFKPDGVGEQAPAKVLGSTGQRAAEKFTPCQRADAHRFTSGQPSDKLCLLRAARHQCVDREVGVDVDRTEFRLTNLPAAVLHCGLPSRGGLLGQPDLLLKFPETPQCFRYFPSWLGHRRQTTLQPRQKDLLIPGRQTRDLGLGSQERAQDPKLQDPSIGVNSGHLAQRHARTHSRYPPDSG